MSRRPEPHPHLHTRLPCSFFKFLWHQLTGAVWISSAHINEDSMLARVPVCHQHCGVILHPGFFVVAQIALERCRMAKCDTQIKALQQPLATVTICSSIFILPIVALGMEGHQILYNSTSK